MRRIAADTRLIRRIRFVGILACVWLGLVLSLGMQSCAYFNTYYNAKRYFHEGVKENEDNETGRPKTTNYQKAIDSAARVLEYYPNSKYVDDALMIMGKAYFETQNYPKAKRKFEELLANYPNSPLAGEAELWLGRSLIAMGQEEQGINVLTKLWGTSASQEIRLESRLRLADYHFQKENYRSALTEYMKYLEAAEDKRDRAQVWLQVGECYFALKEFESAESAFQKALNEKPNRKQEFNAIYKRALTLQQQGRREEALSITDKLLKNEKFFPYIEQVYLSKAEILAELGRIQEAEELFKRTIELYPRSPTSARASYLLGQIYLHQTADFEKAEEYLNKVRMESAQSEFALPAQNIVEDLRYLKILNFKIDSLRADLDTLEYRLQWIAEHRGESDTLSHPDSAGIPNLLPQPEAPASPGESKRPPESLHPASPTHPGVPSETLPFARPGMEGKGGLPFDPEAFASPTPALPPETVPAQRKPRLQPLPTDSAAVYDRMENDRAELAELRFRLAEQLWLQFDYLDSARTIFAELAQKEEYPDVSARSLLSLYRLELSQSPDSTASDSLLRLVHEKFPETEYDRWVRVKLGLEPLPEPVDSAAYSFAQAEHLWMDEQHPREAVRRYLDVSRRYADTEYGPKALYAAAWLQEHILEDVPGALASYDSLVQRYPSSPFAQTARMKIAPPPPEIPDTTAVSSDTSGTGAEVILTGPAPSGSGAPELIGGQQALEDYIHKNHLYPQVAMEAGISGQVIVEFVVDERGRPSRFKVVSEDPEGFDFGEKAIQALQGMRFKPGYENEKYIAAPATQVVIFNP
jgi:TonB family protein